MVKKLHVADDWNLEERHGVDESENSLTGEGDT